MNLWGLWGVRTDPVHPPVYGPVEHGDVALHLEMATKQDEICSLVNGVSGKLGNRPLVRSITPFTSSLGKRMTRFVPLRFFIIGVIIFAP